jgi:copper chaperone CopZ
MNRCDHCRAALTTEVDKVVAVSAVDVDLDTKQITVTGAELTAAVAGDVRIPATGCG